MSQYQETLEGVATWRQEEADWKQRHAYLVCLFKKALELKVELVLTTDEFEAFMPLPGDAFDATCMELSRQAPLREAELREAAEVDKCSMPAFYKLQRNAEESALVQYKKFRWTDAETRGKVELLRKAVVLAE